MAKNRAKTLNLLIINKGTLFKSVKDVTLLRTFPLHYMGG